MLCQLSYASNERRMAIGVRGREPLKRLNRLIEYSTKYAGKGCCGGAGRPLKRESQSAFDGSRCLGEI